MELQAKVIIGSFLVEFWGYAPDDIRGVSVFIGEPLVCGSDPSMP